MVAHVLILAGMLGLTGCLKKLPAFACSDDTQCGAGGACEVNGLCSFADGNCESGRRFGDQQGDQSNQCVGEVSPNPDGGVDTPVDLPTDCPNDVDCDNVADGIDNCPTIANENQFNEDGDFPGDACDKCPPFDDAGQDGDGDGVGDDCDPHPNAGGDVIEHFIGFREMPAGWVAAGSFTVAGGDGIATGAAGEIVTLMTPTPANTHYLVWAEATLDSIAGTSLGAIGVSALHAPGGDLHGALCQLVGFDNGTSEELRLFDTSGGGFGLLDSDLHAFDTGGRYELFVERDGTDLSCDATNPDVSTIGMTTFSPSMPELGLRIRSVTARYHWAMVIRSP